MSFSASATGGTGGYAYTWDFGDGSASATGATVSHTYTATGTFTASLLAKDSSGATVVSKVTITALPAVTVMASGSPTSGAAPLAVNFSSSATGGNGGPYTFSWDFGDGVGTSTLAAPTYTYSSGGSYTATVTVCDSLGDSGSATVIVSPLSVSLAPTPASGNFPFTPTLTASPAGGTGTYRSYTWDFGDGSATATTTAASTTHTYSNPGTYTAKVTVADSGSVSASGSATVTATIPPLALTASATPTSGLAPVTVNLSGSASGGIGPYKYSWDYGDGTSDTGLTSAAVSHVYAVPGTFTAQLTATDSQATPATITKSVSITAKAPVPSIGSVYPPYGPETGGTSVTITGTYFENASAVKFGSKAATFGAPSCDSTGNCTIVATSPAAAGGPVYITVTTPGGTTPNGANQFTYDLAWNATAATGPTAREGAAMVNDGSEVVLFGGTDGLTDLADTWLWNGSAWASSVQVLAPTGRTNAAIADDGVHGAAVLFGGSCTLLSTLQCDLNDTWTWSASAKTWTLAQANNPLPGTNQPSQREGAMLVFDSTRSQVVLFGGYDGSGYLNDTWVYNFTSTNKKWTQLNASNCASTTLPACRAFAAIGRDSSGQVVLFGGANTGGYLGDTWTWNGTAWSSYALSGPTARSEAAMGYFNKPGGGTATGLMLFGGKASTATCASGVCGDTWTWIGGRWENLYATGTAGSPSARYDAAAATDTAGGVLLFGGNTGSADLSDTYLLK